MPPTTTLPTTVTPAPTQAPPTDPTRPPALPQRTPAACLSKPQHQSAPAAPPSPSEPPPDRLTSKERHPWPTVAVAVDGPNNNDGPGVRFPHDATELNLILMARASALPGARPELMRLVWLDVIAGAVGIAAPGGDSRANRIDGPSLRSGRRAEQHPWPIHAVPAASMAHRCGPAPPGNRIYGTSLRPAGRYGPFVGRGRPGPHS